MIFRYSNCNLFLLLGFISLLPLLNAQDEETTLNADDFNFAATLSDNELNYGDGSIARKKLWESGKFEGDMKSYKKPPVGPGTDPGLMFSAISGQSKRWPGGKIPYTLSSRYSRRERGVIAAAMMDFKKKTCVEFVPRSGQRDYLYIYKSDGCWSTIGRDGGRQELSLDDGCVFKGIVIHELMHAVGFIHEQSRSDRDKYIKIKWENIERGLDDQFDKYSDWETENMGLSYDYGSIMHYDGYSFSKNGRATIVTTNPPGARIGQEEGFSALDLKKLNTAYKCANNGGSGGQVTSRPVPPPVSGCSDDYSSCKWLTWGNGCAQSSVRNQCKKSCKECGGRTTRRPITTTTRRPNLGNCEDSSRVCKILADPWTCESLTAVKRDCPKSCNACGSNGSNGGGNNGENVGPGETVVDCEDVASRRYCARMVRRDECYTDDAINCAKACGFECVEYDY